MSLGVLIVDDEPLVRRGLRMIIEDEPDLHVVGEALDGADGVERAERLRPDVVLMDIRMPRLDGVHATRRIVAAGGARVIVLTTFDVDEYVFEALRAGASGFLLKSAPPARIVEAIRVVAGGMALLSPDVTRRVISEFAGRSPRLDPPAAVGQLTERERSVLDLMVKGRTNAEIGAELFIGEATVKTHVARVLSKLGVRDRVQAVILAYETGLVRPTG